MTIENNFLLLLKSAGLGEGEPDLSERLLKSFLEMLLESGSLPAKIICMNRGIFLTTECSPVGDLLKRFVEAGCEILSCGTCLDYYGRRAKLIIGSPTNMRDTVDSLVNFNKVLAF